MNSVQGPVVCPSVRAKQVGFCSIPMIGAVKMNVRRIRSEFWGLSGVKAKPGFLSCRINAPQCVMDALGIRSYLHDRSLMQYADKMEDCGKNLSELINLSTTDLSTQFEMKSGHTARFVNRRISGDSFKLHALVARRKSSIMMHRDDNIPKSFGSNSSNSLTRSHIRSNAASDALEQSMAEMKIKEGYVFKGIVAAE
ncbi:unnamed protein product [Sphenostylis stenocarpa]|uniref:Uncharacterized protein n=1 Tax=Sphenostylis stenocarpa TaxID=92480 RepID=A0AA86SW81_9FABA|nr:unnamed protein product [Sphenostylis stenocarpa]